MGSGQSKQQQQQSMMAPVESVSVINTNNESKDEGGSEKKCPMQRADGSYTYSLKAFFGDGMKNPHLFKQSVSPAVKMVETVEQVPISSGGCPVVQKKEAPTAASTSGCPVVAKEGKTQYNVYSQPIDPNNQMPAVANQLPSTGQSTALPTNRVNSTIPKGGTDDDSTTWTYPSPQMFYNALWRKNKLGDTTEEDIESVVALHNNMNETTWAKVVEWEQVLMDDVESKPKLLKFLGRPSDLSPKARFKHLVLGYPLPFDRHDWTILRADGTEVRYVIDYYHDETQAKETEESAMPDMHDHNAVKSILVDVRPAIDSPQQIVDRAILMPYARHVTSTTNFQPLPLQPTEEMKQQVTESLQVWDNIQKAVASGKKKVEKEATKIVVPKDDDEPQISKKEAVALAKSFASILKDCKELQKEMNDCKTDEECARVAMGLTVCMAKIVCPLQNESMVKSLHAEYDENDVKATAEYNARINASLETVSDCVTGANHRTSLARKQHPKVFSKVDS